MVSYTNYFLLLLALFLFIFSLYQDTVKKWTPLKAIHINIHLHIFVLNEIIMQLVAYSFCTLYTAFPSVIFCLFLTIDYYKLNTPNVYLLKMNALFSYQMTLIAVFNI